MGSLSWQKKRAKPARDHVVPDHSALEKKMDKLVGKDIAKAYTISDKQDRYDALDAAKVKMKSQACYRRYNG